ncbi:neuroepithelial cell-transformingprotein 1 protein isoform X1 [Silurus meridionalis]|nr:neuroepithelial cell-transformingprotein 1 protein isoform X1 [Silurus meridionalis]
MADPLSCRNTTRNRSVFGRRIGTRPPNKAEVMQAHLRFGLIMEETSETPETQVSVPEVTNERPKRKASCKRKSSFAAPDSSPPGSSSSNNNSRRPSLRRGSSFVFPTPGPQWDFTLKRKRRDKEEDAVSLCSFDFKDTSTSLIYTGLAPSLRTNNATVHLRS